MEYLGAVFLRVHICCSVPYHRWHTVNTFEKGTKKQNFKKRSGHGSLKRLTHSIGFGDY